MPVEITDNFLSAGDDVFSQTCAPPGRVSVWAVHNGASKDGFKSEGQLVEHGIPFGHGSKKVVKGFEPAMRPKGDGKKERNIVKGPSGLEYIEMHVDEESMIEKQKWEAAVSNDRVAAAKRKQTFGTPTDGVTTSASVTDELRTSPILSDEERQRLEDAQLINLANSQ